METRRVGLTSATDAAGRVASPRRSRPQAPNLFEEEEVTTVLENPVTSRSAQVAQVHAPARSYRPASGAVPRVVLPAEEYSAPEATPARPMLQDTPLRSPWFSTARERWLGIGAGVATATALFLAVKLATVHAPSPVAPVPAVAAPTALPVTATAEPASPSRVVPSPDVLQGASDVVDLSDLAAQQPVEAAVPVSLGDLAGPAPARLARPASRPLSAYAESRALAAPDLVPVPESEPPVTRQVSSARRLPLVSEPAEPVSRETAQAERGRPAGEAAGLGATASGEQGFLTIVCDPACEAVIVDGKDLGPSPLVHRAVAVGSRRIELRGSAGKKTIQVSIEAGKTTAKRVKLGS